MKKKSEKTRHSCWTKDDTTLTSSDVRDSKSQDHKKKKMVGLSYGGTLRRKTGGHASAKLVTLGSIR